MLKHNTVLQILKKHILIEKKSLVKLLGISMISSALVAIQPLLMQKLIDEAFIPKDINSLYFYSMLIILFGVVGILIASYNQYKYTELSTSLLFSFRLDIFEKVFSQKKEFFQKYKSGDLLTRLEGDILEIQRFGTDSLFALTSATLGMLFALAIMFIFEPALALFSIFLLPFEFMLLKPLYPKMTELTSKTRKSQSSIGSFMIESLRYTLFFKVYDYSFHRVKELKKLQNFHKSNILRQQKLQIIFSQIPVFVSLFGRIVIVFWGGTKVVQSNMQLGEFIAFLTYFGMILGPVQTYLGVLNNLPKIKVSLERLKIFIPNKTISKKHFIKKKSNIEFENFSFKLGKQQIFENVNLSIPYGHKVYIKGANGSGKSTLFEILLNLHSIENGDIKISDLSIQDIEKSSLYKEVAYVEQNPIILASSLRDNLKLANTKSSDENMIEAIKKVGLEKWFTKLENGLDTKLSESGSSLSGGQKQRISIARIFLKSPSIILLDEFTSAIDKDFSLKIEALIDEIFSEETRIIITHKNTMQKARVLRIEDKNLKEES